MDKEIVELAREIIKTEAACIEWGVDAERSVELAANAIDSFLSRKSLLRPANEKPSGCYCQPGKCMAPVIMGRQMPCLDPDKSMVR